MRRTKQIVITAVLLVNVVFGAAAIGFDPLSYGAGLEKGDLIVNAGVGFGGFALGGSMKIPPIAASVEYILPVKNFPVGFGGFMGFSQNGSTSGSYSSSYTNFYAGALANWHFDLQIDKLDLYAGMRLGYNGIFEDVKSSRGNSSSSYGGFYYGAVAGVSYYFTDMFGVNLETGYPVYGKLSLSVRF